MRYDRGPSRGDGVWHCPFDEEWIADMKKLVNKSKRKRIKRKDTGRTQLECLSEPQDSRGLPLSYCVEEEKRFNQHPIPRPAIYDYSTIPEIVATNGLYDWPVRFWERNETL